MIPKKKLAVVLTLMALALAAGPRPAVAETAASEWSDTDHTTVRLISSSETTGNSGNIQLGLQFRMDDSWKVYWRSPGDAGFPTTVDWTGSANLAAAEISWPAPERFSVLGLETLGYKHEVVLPLQVTLGSKSESVGLNAEVNFLTCSEICIPYRVALALDLPPGPPEPSAFAHVINQFSVRVPGNGGDHGLAIETASVERTGDKATLTVTASALMALQAPDLYVEGPVALTYAKPEVEIGAGGRRAVLKVTAFGIGELEGPPDQVLSTADFTFTLVDGQRSVERSMRLGKAAPDMARGATLLSILGLALLGGLILNLMPCVLPVLSLKLLGVVGHGGAEPGRVRLSFIASAAGIIFSFVVLAGGLIALKAGGAAIGWGIQFQQPWFLIAMTVLITLFACNLWGLFEIPLPAWAASVGSGGGLGGPFAQGAFATLLATPCSAPFLGTAVGFALARDAAEIVSVFAMLGFGMSLPYLVVAAVPSLATRLPPPGAWMVRLRQILGFALAATAVWLLTVLAAVAGDPAALIVGGLAAAAGLVLYLARRNRMENSSRIAAVAGLCGLLAFTVPSWMSAPTASGGGSIDRVWAEFDEAAIPGLVADGKTVFVDVTADWCITCQINKTFVLGQGEVLARLGGDGMVAMQADWTRPDEGISRYLAKFGRYGIPFDAVYGPKAPHGIALPELLTERAVLEAMTEAGGTFAISSND